MFPGDLVVFLLRAWATCGIMRSLGHSESAGTWFFAAVNQIQNSNKFKTKYILRPNDP